MYCFLSSYYAFKINLRRYIPVVRSVMAALRSMQAHEATW